MSSQLYTLLLVSGLAAIVAGTPDGSSQQLLFNAKYIGVAFSPYTDKDPKRAWNEYPLEDIIQKLRVVKTRFGEISTYSMGVTGDDRCKQKWDQCESNALIARAATIVNRERSAGNQLKVNIGTYQTPGLLKTEINNAVKAAKDANKGSARTVWGITITNEYVTDADKGKYVLDMINYAKSKNPGLKIGARVHTCEQIYEGGPVQSSLKDIALASDFIYCNMYPAEGSTDTNKAAEEVGSRFLKARDTFRTIKPSLDVRIGETGWPSEKNSFNETPNTKPNLVGYWRAMNNWATSNRVQVQMFSAIDEPWKGDDPNNPNKAESYYGWWNKPDNNNDLLVEKK